MDGLVLRKTLIAPHEGPPPAAFRGTRSAAHSSDAFREITEQAARWQHFHRSATIRD